MFTRRGLAPPTGPFEVNYASLQAHGLVVWWPPVVSVGTLVLQDIRALRPAPLYGNAVINPHPELGHVLALDGTGDYAAPTAVGFGTVVGQSRYTCSLWVSTTIPNTRQCVIADYSAAGASQSFTIEIGGWQQTAAHITTQVHNSQYLDSGVTAVANTLYHIAVTGSVPGNYAAIYINGVLANSTTLASLEPGHTLAIGRGGAAVYLYVNGYIGDSRIYNRDMSADEVWQLYDPATRWELYEPTVRYWPVVVAPDFGLNPVFKPPNNF